jgi:hypothetical protein
VPIEAFRLLVAGDAWPDQGADRDHTIELGQDLPVVAVDQADRLAFGDVVDQPDGKDAGQDRLQDTADAAHAEHIERIVVAQ